MSFHIAKHSFFCARTRLATMLVLGAWLVGCAAMSQDVDRYYRQMAMNFQEAEAKAKADTEILLGKERVLAQTGDLRRYSSVHKEIARLKDWQAHCAKQRERFEQAAQKLEEKTGSSKKSALEPKEPSLL